MQSSNERCTISTDGQLTIKCGQGTILMDCDQGVNGGDYSNFFIWNRTSSVAQQVSIVFRFYQQINISNITLFFWNSPNNSIIVPNVRVAWGDHNMVFTETMATITTNSPNRTEEGQSTLDINMISNELKFQYLRIMMSFYGISEWIFLSEVQFCGKCVASQYGSCIKYHVLWHTGNTAPFHITRPSFDDYVQVVSTTATTVNVMCSLNITIPSTVVILWIHNNTAITNDGVSQTGNTTTLLIGNFQPSVVGDYQCVFNDVLGGGWTIRRTIRLLINSMFM